MRFKITYAILFIFLIFSGCDSSNNGDDISCRATRSGDSLTITLKNNLSRDIEIFNQFSESNDSVPPYTLIKLTDANGSVLTANDIDADGFWTPRYWDSTAIMLPLKMEIFRKGQSIVKQLSLSKMLIGLRNKPYLAAKGSDRVQFKIILYLDANCTKSKVFVLDAKEQ